MIVDEFAVKLGIRLLKKKNVILKIVWHSPKVSHKCLIIFFMLHFVLYGSSILTVYGFSQDYNMNNLILSEKETNPVRYHSPKINTGKLEILTFIK